MVGLIQRLLLELVERHLGRSGVEKVLTSAGIATDIEYRIDTNYSDTEFQSLLSATMSEMKLDQPKLEQLYAKHFINDAQKRWPMWFTMADSARDFLLLQPKIHNGFASAMENERDRARINDKFHFEEEADRIVIHYKSPNRLCGLFVCLAKEVLAIYNETAEIINDCCMNEGDEECQISIIWESTGEAA